MYFKYIILFLFIFIGYLVAKFLNLCIDRMPKGIPIFTIKDSALILDKKKILYSESGHILLPCSVRHAVVELLTPLLFLLTCFKFYNPQYISLGFIPCSNWGLLPVYLIIICGLIIATFVDFEHFIIPNQITVGGVVFGIIVSAIFPSLHNQVSWTISVKLSVLGAVIGFGFLWSVAILGKIIFRKEAMGFGDVKLIAAFGTLFGPQSILFIILASCYIGATIGILVIIWKKIQKRKSIDTCIQFGPYLCAAALLWIFWEPNIFLLLRNISLIK